MATPVRVSESDVERLAAVAGLPLSASDVPAVAVALGVLLTAGQTVGEVPLADDIEAAPVFRP